MNYKIKYWWEHLTERERNLLIEKLYEIDLFELGIEINKANMEYVSK